MKITTVKEDSETKELYFEIDEDTLNKLDWKEGDDLEWVIQDNRSCIIKKKSDA